MTIKYDRKCNVCGKEIYQGTLCASCHVKLIQKDLNKKSKFDPTDGGKDKLTAIQMALVNPIKENLEKINKL